jgi:outer membrane protein assembly factor BamB
MKTFAAVLPLLLVAGATASAQTPRQFTRPAVPAREILDQYNLNLAWRVYIPTDRLRDGLFSVQALENQVLVQTISGTVIALNLADGSTLWRAHVGLPYRVSQPLGLNAKLVFVTQGPRLFALERDTGVPLWELSLPNAPSAPPIADADRLYVSLSNNRMSVYELPKPAPPPEPGIPAAGPEPGAASPARPYSAFGVSGTGVTSVGPVSSSQRIGQAVVMGPQPQFLWELGMAERVEQQPLLTQQFVVLAGSKGTFLASAKVARQVYYSFEAEAPISSQISQVGDVAYVPASDYRVYALNLESGKVLWYFTGGAPILRIPAVNDEDVYVAPARGGLFRLQRATGDVVWQRPNADRFLAANRKFVYAADTSGRLLVLDRARGTELGVYDVRDFNVPIHNEITDRLLLGSHSGLLLCLHDRSYPTPLPMKTEEKPAAPPPGPAPREPKEAEKEEAKTPEPAPK